MTSDSMSARPRIAITRMGPAAPGFLAIPSHAAAVALRCANAPPNAEMAIAKAAPMTPHLTPPDDAAAAVSWANAGNDVSAIVANPMKIPFFDIRRNSFQKLSMFLMRHRSRDVDRRQDHENERLEKRPDEAQGHHGPGNEDRSHREEYPRRDVLAPDVSGETQRQGKDSRKHADDLDQEHQRRQHEHRPHEMLQI